MKSSDDLNKYNGLQIVTYQQNVNMGDKLWTENQSGALPV
jgi:hypothetical protein